ncbi:DUF4340 domain-containing protein [Candidatus Uhrbacteria bacterium]|nr:DUF4340 domain-containing protein [Candidatus Uhrbacteria bacterium]
MNKKILIILAGTFLVLLIGASFPAWKKYIPFSKKASVVSDIFDFRSLSESTAEIFTIQKGTDKKVFTKRGSDWFLDGKKAVFENIRLFFEGFQKAETKERIAKNPENHADLGVTHESGYVVTFTYDKGKSIAYIIGNSTPGETTYFMRKDGSNDVYAVTSVAFYKLSDTIDAWIEKQKEEQGKDGLAPPIKKKQ